MKALAKLFQLLLCLAHLHLCGQSIPSSRSVDWSLAGLRDTTTFEFVTVDLASEGIIGDGVTPNDQVVQGLISEAGESGLILAFPPGEFLFNQTISLTSNVVIRGNGVGETVLILDLGGEGHGIDVSGSTNTADTTAIVNTILRGSTEFSVGDASTYNVGDWIQVIQEDMDLVTSTWAEHSVGQIMKIIGINGNSVTVDSPMRMRIHIGRSPYIQRLNTISNTGIECLTLKRVDNTAPEQSSNINYTFAVNSWVTGVESDHCTFSHIQARRSANLHINHCYLHHAFEYGGGGRAYGVMLHATASECLVENSIFEHLRHAMIVQSGANGNVFAYNYAFDPYWESVPTNAAGDMVLHGNYPYCNLFEQNICQNIVVDNSHGPNGPYNTFFRNRAENYGIFFSADNSPSQNIVANEITNTNFPASLVNYTIQGGDHLIVGNNNKGTLHPNATDQVEELSLTFTEQPQYLNSAQWGGIGTPNELSSETIPAYQRVNVDGVLVEPCNSTISATSNQIEHHQIGLVFPNPFSDWLIVDGHRVIEEVLIFDSLGILVCRLSGADIDAELDTSTWVPGAYIVTMVFEDGHVATFKLIRSRTNI